MPLTSTSTAPRSATDHGGGARGLAHIAVMAALIVVLGVPGALYPFGGAVPITLQSMGVMLAGALLGWRKGALAVLLVLAVGLTGLPVLAGGRAVLPALASPTAGYQLGWVVGAAVTGALVQARAARPTAPWIGFVALLGGVVVVYAFGIPVMAWRAGLSLQQALAANVAFLPGDAVKVVVTAIVAAAAHRALPTLLPRRGVAARA